MVWQEGGRGFMELLREVLGGPCTRVPAVLPETWQGSCDFSPCSSARSSPSEMGAGRGSGDQDARAPGEARVRECGAQCGPSCHYRPVPLPRLRGCVLSRFPSPLPVGEQTQTALVLPRTSFFKGISFLVIIVCFVSLLT